MKRVNFFVLLMLIPFMGFPQNNFNNSKRSNKSTSERFSFKDDLLDDQTDFKLKIPDGNAINDTIRKTYFHYDVFIGTFIPTQKAKLIGVKPVLGVSFGFSSGKTTYDLTAEIRFGETKNTYELANSDITNHYTGGYYGIDIIRDIWTNKKNQILLFGGAGLDLFEIDPAEYRNPNFLEYIFYGEEEIKTKDSRNIFSLNLNFGLMCRFYNKKKNYYAIRYRYNVVDYNSSKILTDVTGNFHSITFSFGGISKDL